MKEFFAYPVAPVDSGLSVNEASVGLFTEKVFIDSDTKMVEAASKPVRFLANELFSDLFGEVPGIKGRKVSVESNEL